MDKYLLLLLVIFSFHNPCTAQNYATVNPGDTAYYAHIGEIFWNDKLVEEAIIIDSTSLTTGGEEYHNYSRFDFQQSLPFRSRKSWLGSSITRFTNGWDVFTNDQVDSIMINVQAAVGNSWVLFRYPNNDFIEATVSGTGNHNFLGITDSVKTITLQMKNAASVPIAGFYNGKELLLSKNYGLVKTFGFRYFPIDTTEYNLSGYSGVSAGYQLLSAAEIFDFNLGDEFHYHNYTSVSAPSSQEVFESRTILSKTISGNGDTIRYLYDRIYYSISWNFSTINTYFIHDTLDYPWVVLSDIKDLGGLPFEVKVAHDNLPFQQFGYSLPFHDTTYFARSRKFGEDFYEYDSVSNYFLWPVGMGIFPKRIYAKGLGEIYETDNTYNARYDSLVYYKKGVEEWGSPLNWSVLLGTKDDLVSKPSLLLFPNPSLGICFIKTSKETDDLFFTLFSITGQEIHRQLLSKNASIHKIDVNTLASGIYGYQIFSGKQVLKSGKLAIQKK